MQAGKAKSDAREGKIVRVMTKGEVGTRAGGGETGGGRGIGSEQEMKSL